MFTGRGVAFEDKPVQGFAEAREPVGAGAGLISTAGCCRSKRKNTREEPRPNSESAAIGICAEIDALPLHAPIGAIADISRLLDDAGRALPLDGGLSGIAPFPVEVRVVAAARGDSYATFLSDATVAAAGRRAATSEGMWT